MLNLRLVTKLVTTCSFVLLVGCGGEETYRQASSSTGKADDSSQCTPVTCEILCEGGFAVDDNGCEVCRCKDPVTVTGADKGQVVEAKVGDTVLVGLKGNSSTGYSWINRNSSRSLPLVGFTVIPDEPQTMGSGSTFVFTYRPDFFSAGNEFVLYFDYLMGFENSEEISEEISEENTFYFTLKVAGNVPGPQPCLPYEPVCPDGHTPVETCPQDASCITIGHSACSGPLTCMEGIPMPPICLPYEPVCPDSTTPVESCPQDASCITVGHNACSGPLTCQLENIPGPFPGPVPCLTYMVVCPDGSTPVETCPQDAACITVGQSACNGPLTCQIDAEE